MHERVTPAEVEATLYAKLAETRDGSEESTRADAGEDGKVDSLEGVELIVVAEELYGVSISDDEVPFVCRSVLRLAEVVSSKIDERWKEDSELWLR